MANRTMAIVLSLVALSAFGCSRGNSSGKPTAAVNMVYGSVECGDGQNSLILGNVDNGSGIDSDLDGYVAQYDISTGVVSFTHLDLEANEQQVRATRSSSGDVYVLGHLTGEADRKIFLAKFDKNLDLEWKATKSGTAENGYNFAADLELDDNGNVWVCGAVEQATTGSSTSRHIWVGAYTSEGSLISETVVRESASKARDMALRIQRSETNLFYVLGSQYEIPQLTLVTTPILINPSLVVNPLPIVPAPTTPVITPVTPSLEAPVFKLSPQDIYLGQFRLEGEEMKTVFEATKNGTADDSYDRPVALDVDATGQAVIGGVLSNEDASFDIWMAKFGSIEEPLWEETFDSTDGQSPVSDHLTDLELDSHGDLFFCGAFAGNLFVGKLDGQSGVLLWKDGQAGSFVSGPDQAVDLDVYATGNLYVIGNLYEEVSNPNVEYQLSIWSCKYDPNGTRLFSALKGSFLASYGMKDGAFARSVTHDSEGRLLALGMVATVNNLKAYLYDGLYRKDIWAASYSTGTPTWERSFSGTKSSLGIESSSTEVTSQSNAGGIFTDSQDGVHIFGDHDSQVTGRDGMYYVLNKEGSDHLPEPVRMNGIRDAEDHTVFGTWNK
ncbi:MAG: hypothetical protein QF645_03325 [Planctomycetota bacterium]|nr:hypothetical protein [Planctomycetota bacterium]